MIGGLAETVNCAVGRSGSGGEGRILDVGAHRRAAPPRRFKKGGSYACGGGVCWPSGGAGGVCSGGGGVSTAGAGAGAGAGGVTTGAGAGAGGAARWRFGRRSSSLTSSRKAV